MGRARDAAYDTLRAEILDWTLQPGTVLAEVELASRLGSSRTPVREALARLVADGLAAPLGGRGLVVAPLAADNIIQLYELRQALEQQAASLAAQRRDPTAFADLREELLQVDTADLDHYYDLVTRFDAAVDDAMQSPYLVTALRSVRTHLARVRRLSRDNPERLRDAAREHLLIVDAIIDGDARLAADATRVHLHRSLQSTLSSLTLISAPNTSADRKPA